MTILNIYSLDDTEQQQAVACLPEGKHVIGRGDLLKVGDKRVSRNHAVIEVCNDTITLTSLHVNPCFFKAVNGRTLTVITQNQSNELNDGDQFALLPEDYWFRVRITREIEENQHSNGKRLLDAQSISSTKKARLSTTVLDNGMGTENNDTATSFTEQPLNNCHSTNTSHDDQEALVVNAQANDETARIENLEQEIISTEIKEEPTNCNEQLNSDIEVKIETIIKEEPQVNGEEPGSSSTLNNIADNANTSLNNAPPKIKIEEGTNNDGTDQIDPPNANGSGTQATARRERCWYGAGCYRKNPNHRITFSHPGDEDYQNDDPPECPYGAACYRRNPEHRRQYKHLSEPAPKPSQRPTASSRPASPDTQNITPNKKEPKRKAATKKNKAEPNVDNEDDYDLEDPFINDGSSDDFEPSDYGIDSSDTDFEDSQEVDEESQERKRMLREAKKFAKNK